MPIGFRLLFIAAVVGLGAVVFWLGTGGVGSIVSGIGGAFGGVVHGVAVTPSPTPTPEVPLSDAPTIVAPDQPYTNVETEDVSVSVPSTLVGKSGYRVRLYVTPKGGTSKVVGEGKVGSTAMILIPGVQLAKGRNDFTATIVGPGGETETSAIVTYVLDQTPPPITISAPKDGGVVNRASAQITGKTQAMSTIVAVNAGNGASANGVAKGDGTFAMTMPLAKGSNSITFTVTDPAGNSATLVLTLLRGTGVLAANLSASAYRFRVSSLPDDVEFTVLVTDPDAKPLAGATVLFTISIPGIEPIVSSQLTTDATGTIRFKTRVPAGATPGDGLATVLVTTGEFGNVTDRQVLTIVQ